MIPDGPPPVHNFYRLYDLQQEGVIARLCRQRDEVVRLVQEHNQGPKE